MATRKVILTERELTSLIKRIIQETEEMESDNETSKEDVKKALGAFFKTKVLPKLNDRQKERIMNKAEVMETKELEEMSLYEEDSDEDEDIDSRKSSFKTKMMQVGGFTTAALGFLGFIGRTMGWSEFETTTKINQFIEQFGAGNYSGPITVAMIVAGLGIAFRGIAKSWAEKNR